MKREELSALRERVEKAERPDRELDAAILMALAPGCMIGFYVVGDDEPTVFHAEPLAPNKSELPHYTASIDAAVALIERKLPGWEWQLLHEWYDAGTAMINRAHINDAASGGVYVSGYGPTPALALIAALLNALENANG